MALIGGAHKPFLALAILHSRVCIFCKFSSSLNFAFANGRTRPCTKWQKQNSCQQQMPYYCVCLWVYKSLMNISGILWKVSPLFPKANAGMFSLWRTSDVIVSLLLPLQSISWQAALNALMEMSWTKLDTLPKNAIYIFGSEGRDFAMPTHYVRGIAWWVLFLERDDDLEGYICCCALGHWAGIRESEHNLWKTKWQEAMKVVT